MGRTLENALAHAKVLCGIRGCDNIAEEDLVALAAEIKRLQDREAQIKPIFLRYEEIAEPFAGAAKVGENRVEVLADGITELREEIKRLQEENKELQRLYDSVPYQE